MKVASIELYQVDLPYSGGVYQLSGGRSYDSFDASIVKITCDDGTTGWGESTPFGSTYIAAHALGTRASLADKRPGEFFLVDANGGLLPETALRMLALLPPGLDFVLEAPCSTWRETLSLRQRCRYPIILDELVQQDEDIAWAAAHDAADGIGLKISKAGGLTPGRRQRDIARAAGLTISVQDTVGSAIAFAAITHLGATVRERLLRCVLNCEDMVTLSTAKFEVVHEDGGILPPDASRNRCRSALCGW